MFFIRSSLKSTFLDTHFTFIIVTIDRQRNSIDEIRLANASTSRSVVVDRHWSNDRLSSVLTESEHRLVQTILCGDENEAFGTIGDQPITRRDLRTLRGMTWLNDEVKN